MSAPAAITRLSVPVVRRLPAGVWLVWGCLFCRLLFFISVVPLWEGFDEYSHFGYLQHLAEFGELPQLETSVSREVDVSLRLAPVPYAQRLHDPAWLTEDAFWQLPPDERARRIQALRELPPGWGREAAEHPQTIWEAQQPPLFYVLFAPVCKALANTWLVTRVWLLRLLAIVLASVAAPLTYWVGMQVFGNAARAVAAAALAVAFPEFVLMQARISNECLAVALGCLLLVATLAWNAQPRNGKWALAVGILAGLALLTKAYFLAVLAVPFGLAIWHRPGWRAGLSAVGMPLVLSGWWYGRNWWRTGSLSGQLDDIAAGHMPLWQRFAQAPHVRWGAAWDNIFTTHIWIGGWSFLNVRSWMYRIFLVLAIAAAGGLLWMWRKRRPERNSVAILAAFYGSLLFALTYHVLVNYVNKGTSASTGWYLYGFAAAEAVLIVAAFSRVRWLLLLTLLCFVALELFATHAYLLPYYAGMIVHLPNGHVPAFPIAAWLSSSRDVLFDHLAVNKPPFVTREVLPMLWLLYVGATFANAFAGFRAVIRTTPR